MKNSSGSSHDLVDLIYNYILLPSKTKGHWIKRKKKKQRRIAIKHLINIEPKYVFESNR